MARAHYNTLFTVVGAYKLLKAYYGRDPRPCEFRRETGYCENVYYKFQKEHPEALDEPLDEESQYLLEMLEEVIKRGDKVI